MLNSLICLIVISPMVWKHQEDQIPFMHTYALYTYPVFRIKSVRQRLGQPAGHKHVPNSGLDLLILQLALYIKKYLLPNSLLPFLLLQGQGVCTEQLPCSFMFGI